MAGKMQNYREEAISTERLTAKLQDEHASFYLAELDLQVIGYMERNRVLPRRK
jgi:hypothetical protein